MNISSKTTAALLAGGTPKLAAAQEKKAHQIATQVVTVATRFAAEEATKGHDRWSLQVMRGRDLLLPSGPTDSERTQQLVIDEVRAQLEHRGFFVNGVDRTGANTWVRFAQNEHARADADVTVIEW